MLKARVAAGDANCVASEFRFDSKISAEFRGGLISLGGCCPERPWADGDTVRGQDGLSRLGKTDPSNI